VKYHQIEPLITQGFNARVAMLFYAALRRKSCIDAISNAEGEEQLDLVIERLTPDEFNTFVEDVRLAAFTSAAWNGTGNSDLEFRSMCRMLQEIQLASTISLASLSNVAEHPNHATSGGSIIRS
jgi:hypothetical protein